MKEHGAWIYFCTWLIFLWKLCPNKNGIHIFRELCKCTVAACPWDMSYLHFMPFCKDPVLQQVFFWWAFDPSGHWTTYVLCNWCCDSVKEKSVLSLAWTLLITRHEISRKGHLMNQICFRNASIEITWVTKSLNHVRNQNLNEIMKSKNSYCMIIYHFSQSKLYIFSDHILKNKK